MSAPVVWNLLFALLPISWVYADSSSDVHVNTAPKVEALLSAVLDKLAPGQWEANFAFTNYRTDKTIYTYALSVQAYDRSTALLLFTAPDNERGRQILNKKGEIWSYLPDSRKIVRLADRESIGNGDFNNADVLKFSWLEDYNASMLKESAAQYVVDMAAKPGRSPTYQRARLWILKDGLQPVQQFFFDEAGHHLKTLKYRKVKTFGAITRPSELVMENMITGQRTLLTVERFAAAKNLPLRRFSQEQLGK